MKNAYIITFHWATNYGAVLQCYALQTYLSDLGYNVKVIDYMPDRYILTPIKCFKPPLPSRIVSKINTYCKENKISDFRFKYLNLTKRFSSFEDMQNHNWEDALFVCGSDQIWNPYFTMQGEGKVTLSYYLDFTDNGKKVAYAASFGVTEISDEMKQHIIPLLNSFDKISVRENTANSLLGKMGIKSQVVCDPVFLIDKQNYIKLLEGKGSHFGLFYYVLHGDKEISNRVLKYIKESRKIKNLVAADNVSVTEWLSGLYNADYVVTNSFHAIAFSIIFHIPFVALLIKGSGMNDRIETLLKAVDLCDRCIIDYDEKRLSEIVNNSIDWQKVDESIDGYRKSSQGFLNFL